MQIAGIVKPSDWEPFEQFDVNSALSGARALGRFVRFVAVQSRCPSRHFTRNELDQQMVYAPQTWSNSEIDRLVSQT